MKVLVVNDDGIKAEGIRVLVETLLKYPLEIVVVAPSGEQSAVSQALTLRRGMSFKEMPGLFGKVPTYALDGTPADCVNFTKHHLKYDFDLVISGCNNGLNMGYDILYSGTVGGASEALIYGKRGIAVSCAPRDFASFIEGFSIFFADLFTSDIYKDSMLLNVNFPPHPKGIKITHQGINPFNTVFVKQDDLYFAKGKPLFEKGDTVETSDLTAYHDGYISVTPLTIDRTDYQVFNKYCNK